MGAIGLDLSFLDSIELKDTAAKGIRFNDNETYMLKFVEYKGMKFSGYVKNLIIDDIRKHCDKDSDTGGISKSDMKEMILEALRENNYIKKENDEEVTDIKDDEILALGELGISKRS